MCLNGTTSSTGYVPGARKDWKIRATLWLRKTDTETRRCCATIATGIGKGARGGGLRQGKTFFCTGGSAPRYPPPAYGIFLGFWRHRTGK